MGILEPNGGYRTRDCTDVVKLDAYKGGLGFFLFLIRLFRSPLRRHCGFPTLEGAGSPLVTLHYILGKMIGWGEGRRRFKPCPCHLSINTYKTTRSLKIVQRFHKVSRKGTFERQTFTGDGVDKAELIRSQRMAMG